MKISLTKIIAILSLAIVIFVSVCPPSLAALRREAECGVERYNSGPSPACGEPTYKLARSPACGVERYKEAKSSKCPGFISKDSRWLRDIFPCSAAFPGYRETGETKMEDVPCPDGPGSSGRGGRDVLNPNPSYGAASFVSFTPKYNYIACAVRVKRCERPEVIETCRLPDFGVETYNECRNIAHEIESFPTCERPEFGVASYNECEIRKTRAELTAYIANLDPNIDVMGVALLQNTGNLLKLDSNETGLACYIKRWDSDPLFSDAISDLKTIQFPALFGVAYDPSKYNCSGQTVFSLPTTSCSDGSPRCKFQTAYNASVEFFTRNKDEVTALLDDVVARNDETVKAQLQALNAKLDNYFKS